MPIDTTVSAVIDQFRNVLLPESIQFVLAFSPVFLAILLGRIFWELWVDYVRGKNFLERKYTVLELKLPKDTWKSPKAMEVFLNSLHNTADGSFYNRFWKGGTRPWYSLELVSVEGVVKFMVWTEEIRKQGVMSALYSQFPEIQIKEVDDYSKSLHFDPSLIRIWACELMFTNKDQAYPIKTYIDYGLDKDPKEEYKVDPMLPLIEFLGSVGPNQQIWIQILLQAHKPDKKKEGMFFETTDSWKDEAEALVHKLLLRDPKTKIAGVIDKETGFTKLPSISEIEKESATAVERRITKFPFDVGIRCMYIAKKDVFNTPFGIGGTVSSFKHFSAPHFNGFKPNGKRWHSRIDDPWDDFMNWRRNKYGRLALMAFKRRSYFYPPFKGKPMIMNAEEIATIYHFPGSVAQTPNLERVPSKRAQAPGNLPI